MKSYRLVFSPETEGQIVALYNHITAQASPATAKRFTDAIIERCERLVLMPKQGRPRGDLRPGLRTISFRKRVVIAYALEEASLTIVGIFYGGQDYEALLQDDDASD